MTSLPGIHCSQLTQVTTHKADRTSWRLNMQKGQEAVGKGGSNKVKTVKQKIKINISKKIVVST